MTCVYAHFLLLSLSRITTRHCRAQTPGFGFVHLASSKALFALCPSNYYTTMAANIFYGCPACEATFPEPRDLQHHFTASEEGSECAMFAAETLDNLRTCFWRSAPFGSEDELDGKAPGEEDGSSEDDPRAGDDTGGEDKNSEEEDGEDDEPSDSDDEPISQQYDKEKLLQAPGKYLEDARQEFKDENPGEICLAPGESFDDLYEYKDDEADKSSNTRKKTWPNHRILSLKRLAKKAHPKEATSIERAARRQQQRRRAVARAMETSPSASREETT